MTPVAATLESLAARFDHFLIDQFGVLLDGSGAYPEAAETLAHLARMGKAIVLLSNSGKRSAANHARLGQFGIARTSYRRVLSSGECAFHAFSALRDAGQLLPGDRVLVLSRDGDLSPIEGLDLVVTEDAGRADFVLIAGSEGERIPLADYRHRLAPAAARGARAFCLNPDRIMLTPSGPTFGAGVIAEAYAEMGGEVTWIGKPYPQIYAMALEELGGPDPAQVLCIGDSPAHDIRGGRGAGMATALVRTGIHAALDLEAVLALCEAEAALPDVILPRFAF